MTGSNVDLMLLANSSSLLSPRFRLRRSMEPHGASATSTLTDARSCRMLAPDRASRGPKTVAETVVRPWVMEAEPSADLSCEPPSVIAMERSSYCLRPSMRNPPAFRSYTLDCEEARGRGMGQHEPGLRSDLISAKRVFTYHLC